MLYNTVDGSKIRPVTVLWLLYSTVIQYRYLYCIIEAHCKVVPYSTVLYLSGFRKELEPSALL